VLGFDLGAIGDRIKEYHLGYVIEPGSGVDAIADKIQEIFAKKEEHKNVSINASKYKIKSMEEMNRDYNAVYSGYPGRDTELNVERLKSMVKKNSIYYNGMTVTEELREVKQSYTLTAKELERVKHSYTYRVGKLILALPKQVKKMVGEYKPPDGIKICSNA
jgi:hypothetical protein